MRPLVDLVIDEKSAAKMYANAHMRTVRALKKYGNRSWEYLDRLDECRTAYEIWVRVYNILWWNRGRL